MKLIHIATTASLWFFNCAAARQCPLESDCIQNLCTNFTYENGMKHKLSVEKPIVLTARCKNDANEDIITSLDLTKCIANVDGLLKWAEGLESEDSYLRLQCEKCPKKLSFFRGTMWSWLDLCKYPYEHL
ncbi:CVNH domain-containing protein [Colletotrichum truncatum]|uniref:CVNH domain-containing protein n=1 Tax=Colletotrichum truncatum TaxID=5467 RepID=A0ACC3YSJ0_COLTU|nr:CVNH domain-containing protein [Colletotrichum truncatum]KAF6789725.1 CVNH domain-containing protein [Colletotrichum truncatum]